MAAFQGVMKLLMAMLALVICSTAAHAQVFANKTTADGLGGNTVSGVFANGTSVYAATNGGLSISTNGGATFINKTTADGLGDNIVFGVFVDGTTVYAATVGGLSISSDQPTVAAVNPNSGSILGGTSITITGTYFTGATSITVGGVACTAFNVVNSTTATCNTPPGTVGTTSVRVTTPAGTSSANTLFTYVVPVASAAAPIPTLSEWTMLWMASLMAMLAFVRMRRQ